MKKYLKKELEYRDRRLKYDFLPSMIEIIEKPANRMGIFILYTVIALIISTIVWACITRLDVAVVATGTVDADNALVTLSTLTEGTISEVMVKDGEFVNKGDIICKLSSEVSEATLNAYEYNLTTLKIEKEVYEEIYSKYENGDYSKIELDINNYGDNYKVAEAIILENDVFVEKLKALSKDDAEIEKSSQLLLVIQNINSIDSKIESISAELEEGKKSLSDRTIIATESGRFSSGDKIYAGKNIDAGETIGYISRSDNKYKFNANILDEDISQLKEGDKVKLKIVAFDDTKYEYIDGCITRIGDIPLSIEGKGVVYDIDIEMNSIPDNLKIGMEGSIDIIVGNRTVMDYFLEPFRKGLEDSLKER